MGSARDQNQTVAVPWLRRLAAGLPTWRPGFDPGSVHVRFVVDKVALGQVFPPSSSVFPCQFLSTGAPLLGKGQKIIIIFIFITGLHNKPHGCGASVASAAGPFTTKKTKQTPGTPQPEVFSFEPSFPVPTVLIFHTI
jgi:hypothetical protein